MILRPAVSSYPDGYYQIDYTFTPTIARIVLSSLPHDSFHWDDMERKRTGKLEEYVKVLKDGRWENWDNGHPIRFNKDGELTHGFVRLLACYEANIPLRTVVVFPPNSRWSELLLEAENADA